MKKSYTTVEDAYNDMFGHMSRKAESILNNPDCAFDCVQDVFVKLTEYKNKFPERNLRSFLINAVSRKYNRKMFAEFQTRVLLSRNPVKQMSDADQAWKDQE